MENQPPPPPRPSSDASSGRSETTSSVTPTHGVPTNVTVNVPDKLVVQPARSRFGRLFGILGWIGLLLCIPTIFGLKAQQEEYFGNTEKSASGFIRVASPQKTKWRLSPFAARSWKAPATSSDRSIG